MHAQIIEVINCIIHILIKAGHAWLCTMIVSPADMDCWLFTLVMHVPVSSRLSDNSWDFGVLVAM
jgi:hypothetical protein